MPCSEQTSTLILGYVVGRMCKHTCRYILVHIAIYTPEWPETPRPYNPCKTDPTALSQVHFFLSGLSCDVPKNKTAAARQITLQDFPPETEFPSLSNCPNNNYNISIQKRFLHAHAWILLKPLGNTPKASTVPRHPSCAEAAAYLSGSSPTPGVSHDFIQVFEP